MDAVVFATDGDFVFVKTESINIIDFQIGNMVAKLLENMLHKPFHMTKRCIEGIDGAFKSLQQLYLHKYTNAAFAIHKRKALAASFCWGVVLVFIESAW